MLQNVQDAAWNETSHPKSERVRDRERQRERAIAREKERE